MTETLGASKIAVIDDGTPYSVDLASTVSKALGTDPIAPATIG